VRRPAGIRLALAVLALSPAGCGGDRGNDRSTASVDSTLFGDDRTVADTARAVVEVALLERLIDEYEGLDVLMDRLAGPASGSPLQGRASKGDRHEDAAKARLLDVLQSEYGERYQPRTPKGVGHIADSIEALPTATAHGALDAVVLSHHRRVARAIGDALPSVRNAGVREVLTELQDHLRKEIRQLSAR
jgi:hypothetical protein